jgi:pyridinium-3,5-bisthiocarboxylic acid mononucleotide nickel chelatase
VWLPPVQMKKGRPGVLLSVLTTEDLEPVMVETLLRETTTLGVRMHDVHRRALDREWIEVAIDGHPVRVKVAKREGRVVSAAPEFEDARLVAIATGHRGSVAGCSFSTCPLR